MAYSYAPHQLRSFNNSATDDRYEVFLNNPSLLWTFSYSDDCFHDIKLAVKELMNITGAFENKFERMGHPMKRQMFPFYEYILTWIAFMFTEDSDMKVIPSADLEQIQVNMASTLQKLRRSILSADEAQVDRTMAQFEHLSTVLKENETRSHVPLEPRHPFFKSVLRFRDSYERNMMQTLHRLYKDRRNLTLTETLAKLEEISQTFPVPNVDHIQDFFLYKYESSRDTAIRAITGILNIATESGGDHTMSYWTFSTVKAYLECLNHSSGILLTLKVALRNDEINGQRFNGLVPALRRIEDAFQDNRSDFEDLNYADFDPDDEFEVMPDDEDLPVSENLPVVEKKPNPSSLLWKKLEGAESVEALLKKMDRNCTICMKDDITNLNFAILDNCCHLFCHDCIGLWFEKRTMCPLCRANISVWTTKEYFLEFLNKKCSIVSTEKPKGHKEAQ